MLDERVVVVVVRWGVALVRCVLAALVRTGALVRCAVAVRWVAVLVRCAVAVRWVVAVLVRCAVA